MAQRIVKYYLNLYESREPKEMDDDVRKKNTFLYHSRRESSLNADADISKQPQQELEAKVLENQPAPKIRIYNFFWRLLYLSTYRLVIGRPRFVYLLIGAFWR
uniref:Uncharacterized protein n=1 Tax=Onchocerca volvulus TaxID=6282 RepID=A0A8R1Y0X3_ONCVO